MKTANNITITINKQSKILKLIITTNYCLLLILIVAIKTNYKIKILIVILSSLSLYNDLEKHFMKSNRKTIKSIHYNHPGFWRLSLSNGNSQAALLKKPIFKTTLFIILNFEDLETKENYKILIAKDSIDSALFHKLRFLCNILL